MEEFKFRSSSKLERVSLYWYANGKPSATLQFNDSCNLNFSVSADDLNKLSNVVDKCIEDVEQGKMPQC